MKFTDQEIEDAMLMADEGPSMNQPHRTWQEAFYAHLEKGEFA